MKWECLYSKILVQYVVIVLEVFIFIGMSEHFLNKESTYSDIDRGIGFGGCIVTIKNRKSSSLIAGKTIFAKSFAHDFCRNRLFLSLMEYKGSNKFICWNWFILKAIISPHIHIVFIIIFYYIWVLLSLLLTP